MDLTCVIRRPLSEGAYLSKPGRPCLFQYSDPISSASQYPSKSRAWRPSVLSLQFELDCVLNALVSLLQGSFVASMTATLRQMDDYHYAHLISTFGKIRSDVVVSTPHQCVRVCWLRLRRHVATSKHRPLVQCHILELRSSIRFPRKMFFLHNKEWNWISVSRCSRAAACSACSWW